METTTTNSNERKIKFVVFWERMANSGVIEVFASSHEEAIKYVGFNPEYVKITVYQVEGEKFTIGKANLHFNRSEKLNQITKGTKMKNQLRCKGETCTHNCKECIIQECIERNDN